MSWKTLITSHTKPGHLIGMGAIAAVLVGVFVLFGQSLRQALPYAASLACPLMMVAMMFGMHGSGHGDVAPREHDRHDGHHPAAGGLGGSTESSSNLQ